ncbi:MULTISPECIES: ROK family protein [unclassified Streptomyces]|uniref:ROK family protein n=1 Tax=unclassified Streptomyces TaxID=2593676 RepID=UPI002258E57C|nr:MULTISPECIES: ROK family protein [unclassified Streptomyces]MCX4398696.1 ROK family protein [Streptomyces sp. NBC_01767]WSP50995.1 ROK family protein [Streptomyces sp. NBC_01243]
MTESFPLPARDQTPLRRVNELSVLAVLRDGAPRSLREVSHATGLSWRTTQVVAEGLGTHGWLAETEAASEIAGRKAVGRPARRYRFRAEAGHVVGLDIGVHRVQVLVADLAAEVVGSGSAMVSPRDPAPDRLAAAQGALNAALAEARLAPADIWAAAMGTSGIVGPDGTVTTSALLPGWNGLNPGKLISPSLHCDVEVANDANLAALGERWRGHGAKTVIYVLVGTRLGAGLIIDGRLHRGAAGAAGEIGALRGAGWPDAAERLATTDIGEGAAGDRDHAAYRVFAAARAGNQAARAAVDRFAADIAHGIAAMVLTIDPELVVLGGGFSHAADLLLPRLGAELAGTCPHLPLLKASALGDDVVALGALRLALDTVDQRLTELGSAEPLTAAAIRGL